MPSTIINHELIVIPCETPTIIASATTSFAPEEIPSTNGPAIGFLKNVCSKNPDTAKCTS